MSWDLNKWLEYLNKLHPKEMDFGLDRVKQVAHRLKLLPVPYQSIVVAGTNGKGTTCHLLENIYRHAGYKTGLYTSPHLLHFNERIIVNGNRADQQSICQAFAKIEAARAEISLTYFEFALLASLLVFQNAQIDIAVLEVGLGGRLDAVNIVDADLSAISTIDFDHMQWLGNTREQIGFEKAGVFRAGKPAICGDPDVPVTVKEYAAKLNATLYCQAKDFSFNQSKEAWNWSGPNTGLQNLPLPAIPLQNASTALMIVEALHKTLPVTRQDIDDALAHVFVPGRFQVFQKHCPVILDVAHNPQSAGLLAENLKAQSLQGKTYAVFSALADKDIEAMLKPMLDVIDYWYISVINTARAADRLQLTESLAGCDHAYYASLEQAYQSALSKATAKDRIVVFGSFYVVAAILPIVQGITCENS